MIGGLGGFGRGDPSKRMERLFGFHSLLPQRCRSLFFGPFLLECRCSDGRGLSAFSTNLTQKHGFFDILAFKRKEGSRR